VEVRIAGSENLNEVEVEVEPHHAVDPASGQYSIRAQRTDTFCREEQKAPRSRKFLFFESSTAQQTTRLLFPPALRNGWGPFH
jgi:hypothetical protein